MANGAYPAINLVGLKINARALRKNKQRRLTNIGIYSLVGFLLIFVPILVFRWSAVGKKDRVETEIADITETIEKMMPVETKYVLLAAKAGGLEDFLARRVSIEPKIWQVYEIMPAGSEIGEVSFGEQEGQLQISVEAADVFAVGQLIDNISQAVGTRFAKVSITSTKRDVAGIYKVAMELVFEKQI